MNKIAIINTCKELGCCNACCLRYLGYRSPEAYVNSCEFITKLQTPTNQSQDEVTDKTEAAENGASDDKHDGNILTENGVPDCNPTGDVEVNGRTSPPAKRLKTDTICTSCLGVLQEETWPKSFEMVKDMLGKKGYECDTFACALSAPIATILREKAITLRLSKDFPDYDPNTLTPLKEAWKWSFGVQLEKHIDKSLDSGAVSPLLVTLTMEYRDDLQELEIVKSLSPELFEARSRQKKRFAVEFTRRSVEEALRTVSLEAWGSGLPAVGLPVACVAVLCIHAPLYLGGRYIKLSRELPQTPWILNGQRIMDSSVQEIIFDAIASVYQLPPEEAEHRLKFISAGREDVDVRCLGDGRPFAVEISDPHRELTREELQQVCEHISRDGKVLVKRLVPVTKDDLTELKKGEETKCKTYEALCIKLSHSEGEPTDGPIVVTVKDIENINTYRNTPPEDPARILLRQKTPIRVLHRRPLLVRPRKIFDLHAQLVPGRPRLAVVRVRTEAGTYVKEWAHAELGRTWPSLAHAARAQMDILALDVASVDLHWPNNT